MVAAGPWHLLASAKAASMQAVQLVWKSDLLRGRCSTKTVEIGLIRWIGYGSKVSFLTLLTHCNCPNSASPSSWPSLISLADFALTGPSPFQGLLYSVLRTVREGSQMMLQVI